MSPTLAYCFRAAWGIRSTLLSGSPASLRSLASVRRGGRSRGGLGPMVDARRGGVLEATVGGFGNVQVEFGH